MAEFVEADQSDLPCPVRFAKIFRFALHPNQIYIHRRPAPHRGAFRDRHEREAGCGGREDAADEQRMRGRRSRVVLTPRRWRQAGGVIRRRRWQTSPVTGESTKETVKT